MRQRLGTSARLVVAGERVTITLTGTPPDALAQWLTQARVNARALPGEARLSRNSAGLWEGTLVLTLPAALKRSRTAVARPLSCLPAASTVGLGLARRPAGPACSP